MALRFRWLAVFLLLVMLEIGWILSRFLGSFEVLVQLATIAAVMFGVYTWEKEQLRKRTDLVEQLRFWANQFYYQTKHVHKIPTEPKEKERIRVQAAETEAGLIKALARCANMIGSGENLARAVEEFMGITRELARMNEKDFLAKLKDLASCKDKINREASNYINRTFKVRFVAARQLKPFASIMLAAVVICTIVLLLLSL
jgi:hypothetical protein